MSNKLHLLNKLEPNIVKSLTEENLEEGRSDKPAA
jgi:hypothetical protein